MTLDSVTGTWSQRSIVCVREELEVKGGHSLLCKCIGYKGESSDSCPVKLPWMPSVTMAHEAGLDGSSGAGSLSHESICSKYSD